MLFAKNFPATSIEIYFQKLRGDLSQQISTCLTSTIKALEKGVKHDQC